MKKFEGKTVVISGGASGIGQAIAIRMAEEGANIVIADLANAELTLDKIARGGGTALAVECDVGNIEGVAKLKEVVEAGGRHCDILVNNAGIYPMQSFDQILYEDWRRVMAVNLDSLFLMTKALASGMRERGWGRIINMASDTVNLVLPNFSHYIASKNGVIGWTRGIAAEFGKYGVTVNAIAPGLTRTENTVARKGPDGAPSDGLFELIKNMQSIKRTQEPSDLAGAVSFLASDDAKFITGQTLYVNGGITHST